MVLLVYQRVCYGPFRSAPVVFFDHPNSFNWLADNHRISPRLMETCETRIYVPYRWYKMFVTLAC